MKIVKNKASESYRYTQEIGNQKVEINYQQNNFNKIIDLDFKWIDILVRLIKRLFKLWI